ncbi:MAG: type II toxin-antitoxin system RelE/ParE family toxin [Kiritimatiellia bacterium]
MACRLMWSPAARLDLRELFVYIAEDDPAVAAKFIRSLFHAVERLPSFPESGRIVPEFHDPEIREVIRRPCRIVYRIKDGSGLIEIVRVWHAARGFPEL